MARLVFRDFDEFADSLRGIAGQFIPTAPAVGEWWTEAVRPGGLTLFQAQIGGSTTFAGDGQPGSYTLGVPMTDPAQIRIDSHQLEPDSYLLLREDQPFTFTGKDVVRWAGVTIPLNNRLVEAELFFSACSSGGTRLRTALPSLDRLRRITERANSAASNVSEPAAITALEQEVGVCVAHILECSTRVRDRRVSRQQFSRGRVIARTLSVIEANDGQPLFIDDMCRATQVSERSLRNIFHEFFGVGPMRLLKVRQLREIRAALLRADPQRDTVARIAARFGIWDFSLFARNYKQLFGEAPSRTLRTPPDYVKAHSSPSWLYFASKVFIDDLRMVSRRIVDDPADEPNRLDELERLDVPREIRDVRNA